ncbi:hypothetical protein MRX96_037685 [Rhipicephalus microplus]
MAGDDDLRATLNVTVMACLLLLQRRHSRNAPRRYWVHPLWRYRDTEGMKQGQCGEPTPPRSQHAGDANENFVTDSYSGDGSVCEPRLEYDAGQGYLEDRRPGANVEPHSAAASVVKAVRVRARMTGRPRTIYLYQLLIAAP